MTLISTHIAKHGIIHAADSNVTHTTTTSSGNVSTISAGKKAYDLRPHLNAALTLAGSFMVGGLEMPIWMQAFIDKNASIHGTTLASFAEALSLGLTREMSNSEKSNGIIIHIAGYVEGGDGYNHPEFWFVRNVHGIQPTGEYTGLGSVTFGEDFWSRDCPNANLMSAFEKGAIQHYANGFHEGRMPFMAVQQYLPGFFATVWSQPQWHLRPPSTINGLERLVRLYMQIVTTLFEISEIDAPSIGGEIQTIVIPAPDNTVKTP